MHDKVLIDTCAWIDFLRSTDGVLGNFVTQALESDKAVICGVVITELLQRAKGKKELQKLNFIFSTLEVLPVNDNDWYKAGEMLQKLRSKGVTLPITDALIATVAKNHEVPICTIDKHFLHLAVDLVDIIKL